MLTIVVPFYDEVTYLRTALNSILAQRIDPLQIIVVNDNPDQFGADDLAALGVTGAVELVQHPTNLGLSAARNSGLSRARGEFVGFLDADDYYTLGGLTHQLERASDTGADITHAQTYFTRLGSAEARILPRDAACFATPRTVRGLADAEQAQFITSSWSSLYRRDFLTTHDLWFDAEQTRFEDRLFVLNTVTRAGSITFTGRPTRVWRRRAGSISVSGTTPHTHLLQVQLLEKCLTHMRAEVATGRLRAVFEKRELFNTVSRLIWDMDLIDAINDNADPAYAHMAGRITALLGDHRFGQPIFSDKVLGPISRVGMTTRKGRISRAAFFSIHRAMRQGDFADARAQIGACAAPPAARSPDRTTRAKRLILHLGLHKTGTTYLQHHLTGHRAALLRHGILVPRSGFETMENPVRAGATPGHQGLVRALHRNDPKPWRDLSREIVRSGAQTVVLSCENMGFPILPEREEKIALLADRLGGFDRVELIVLARRADAYVESFFRERVSNGGRATSEGIAGFVADHAAMLCDLKALFAPFEERFNTRIKLADFDALAARDALWPGFAALAGLPDDLPVLEVTRYDTPDRATTQVIHLLNTLVGDAGMRAEMLTAWFLLHPSAGPDSSLLSPGERLKLLDLWQGQSGEFARERGYDPDLAAARAALEGEDWKPPQTLPAAHLQDLIRIANQATATLTSKTAHSAPSPRQHGAGPSSGGMSLTIRLRPWAADVVHRIRSWTGR